MKLISDGEFIYLEVNGQTLCGKALLTSVSAQYSFEEVQLDLSMVLIEEIDLVARGYDPLDRYSILDLLSAIYKKNEQRRNNETA